MTDKVHRNVQCNIHGEREATFVCRHIVGSLDSKQAVGFHWPRGSSLARPDAWCSECEQVRVVEGEWTDKAAAFLGARLLCGGCYDRAKNIWLEARRADARSQL